MPPFNFRDVTPEQRAEMVRKSAETRARKKLEGIPTVATDAGAKKKHRRKAPRESAPRLSKTDYQKYLRLGLRVFAGIDDIDVFEVGGYVGFKDATKSPDYHALSEADQKDVRETQIASQRVFNDMLAAVRAWCPADDRLTNDEADMIAGAVAAESGKANRALAPMVAQIKQIVAPLIPVYQFIRTEARTFAVVAAIAMPRISRRLPMAQMRVKFGMAVLYGPITWIARGKASQLLGRISIVPDADSPGGQSDAAASTEQTEAGAARIDSWPERVGEDDAAEAVG